MEKNATYRVQLRPEFGFEAAQGLVDYWVALGISHVYTSPYLQAADGSAHGYDVIDHDRVNRELGGESARERFCQALAAHGLGQLLDIVPNHMAIRGGHNAWWWDVLENGPSSRFSNFFDVEWHAATQDHVLLPILGDQYGVELEKGHIQLQREGGRFSIQYYEHRVPTAPRSFGIILHEACTLTHSDQLGFLADAFFDLPLPNATDYESRRRRHRDKQVLQQSLNRLLSDHEALATAVDAVVTRYNSDPDLLHEVLERQNYRLAYWRVGNHELDYRRFFDIDSLVGLRVEDEEVFDATHRLPLAWCNEGSIDGLRIDHIDGLYDPEGYLERLRARVPGAWLLVEKILEGDETLRLGAVAGTTGYDFLNHVQRLFTAPDGEPALTQLHAELNPDESDFGALVRQCKRMVLEQALASDLKRLSERLNQICYQKRRYRDFSRFELTEALRELCVAFPVYRTYSRSNSVEPHATDRAIIQRACRRAAKQNQELDPRLFEFLQRLLTLEWDESQEREFVMRWQQLTGPAMAKGLEDTAFYRYGRLVALNEVGGDPERFHEAPETFHAWVKMREATQPCPLNATSTHDTKRSEDVRARLLVLSEVPERWREAVQRWRTRLDSARVACPPPGPERAPDAALEYLLLQNLVGAWPIEKERMLPFAEKAMREAKRFSSWQKRNQAYEHAALHYLERLYDDRELMADIDEFVASIRDAGFANSLAQLLIKVLVPGVPDIYQGTELWDFSLVDPDNRRPVDYQRRRQVLAQLEQANPERLWAEREGGAIKTYVVERTLALRARRPECFAPGAAYEPLKAQGHHADRVIAFRRGGSVLAVATRWFARHGFDFADTTLTLPDGRWHNVLLPNKVWSGTVPLGDVLGPLVVAALERVNA